MKNISLENFCEGITHLKEFPAYKKALALLLWLSENTERDEYSSGELSFIMNKNGLGSPNSTQLKKSIMKSRLASRSGTSFRLKLLGKTKIYSWVENILKHTPSNVNHEAAFLPEEIWVGTRGYLEKVCEQLNGCFQYGFYDAAAVLMRRIVETLMIESFVQLGREMEIKDSSGNYMMMGRLVDTCLKPKGLQIGRDSKQYLKELKSLGDRSAHKRNYNAIKNDLIKIQTPLRVVVDELMRIAKFKK